MLLLAVLLGCAAPAPSAPSLLVDVRVVGDAAEEAPLPMVVVIHGRGDDPEGILGLLDGLDTPVRAVAPAGPEPFGDGFTWFPLRAMDADPDDFAAWVDERSDRVAEVVADALTRYPTVGRPVVTGFSQGGILAEGLAVHHPERFSRVVPIGGMLPLPAVPASASRAQRRLPVRALHGTADEVIPYVAQRRAIAALAEAGFDAQLQGFDGLGHAVDDRVRAALHAEIAAAFAPASPTGP